MTKKDAILAAAKELFGTLGYAQTTFKKISEHAGASLGLLAHHYGSKEQLYYLAVKDVMDSLAERLEERSSRGRNGLERVMLFCRAYMDFSLDKNAHYLLLIRCAPYSITPMAENSDFRKGFARVLNLLDNLLEEGVEDKSLDITSPASARRVIVSCLLGCCRIHLLTILAEPELYEEVLAFIHKGIAAKT